MTLEEFTNKIAGLDNPWTIEIETVKYEFYSDMFVYNPKTMSKKESFWNRSGKSAKILVYQCPKILDEIFEEILKINKRLK